MKAGIDQGAFEGWRSKVNSELAGLIPLERPSLRALVALAFTEKKGQPLSYSELAQVIRNRGVFYKETPSQDVKQFLETDGLRVAVSTIARDLKASRSGLQIVSSRIGRESRVSLQGNLNPLSFDRKQDFEKIRRADTALTDPEVMARSLLRDGGGLTFASAYASYRSAAKWLSFSSEYSRKKARYEAEGFFKYGLDKQCLEPNKPLVILGLAPGEGLGEVELLRLLLPKAKKLNITIYYLAVDISDFLVASHAKLIEGQFSAALKEGTLKPIYWVGDLYDLKSIIKSEPFFNALANKEGQLVVTFLGNCLGNFEYHEWDFFRMLIDIFPKKHLTTLLGVSVLRKTPHGKPIQEKYSLDPFWLETPKHLLRDMRVLESLDSEGQVIDPYESSEFQLSEEEAAKHIPFHAYETAQGIKGVVYRFYYELKHGIQTSDGNERMEKGQSIHLYSIIKYELSALVDAIRKRAFDVKYPERSTGILKIKSGKEEFHYAVFAASRTPRGRNGI